MSSASLDSRDSQATQSSQKLSPIISQRLNEFRGRLRQRKLLQLLITCSAVLLAGFLAQFTLDRFIDTPKLARAAIGLSVIGVVGLACWSFGTRWFWNTQRLTQVAKLLRTAFPRLSDQVLSVVELASADGEQRRSPELVAAAMAQVEKRVAAVNLLEALPRGASKSMILVTAAQVILVVAIFALTPGAARNALARMLSPWNSIERFTFARVNALPMESIVASGEPFKLCLTLDAGSDWKPASANCWISGRKYQATLDPVQGTYEFDLPGLIEDSQVQFSIGDCMAKTLVVPLNRPELSELNAQIELPSYLSYPRPIRSDARSGSLYLLPDSRLQLSGRANRALSEMRLSKASASQPSSPISFELRSGSIP